MRALILNEAGQKPAIGEFKEPIARGSQKVVKVLAAGLNPVDHYLSMQAEPVLPRIVGREGIGELDGKRVYFEGVVPPYGSIAEQTLVEPENTIELPERLENGPALVLGIAGLAGWLPLNWAAKLQSGETVLVLGATGVQGQVAVQAAKLLGAGKVIAAGRNREVLESLRERGADEIAVLEGDIAAALRQAAPEGGYDVVIDSLFGEPFKGLVDSGTLTGKSRVVTLGGSAGQEITLRFRELQATKGATFRGYSSFGVPSDIKREAYLAMAQHTLDGKLHVDVKEFSLDQAIEAWDKQAEGPHHKLIIVP